jgi:HTH-type transcriptional regulator / antitoxin HipB
VSAHRHHLVDDLRSCRASPHEVATLIRRTREDCGLTQLQLARRMGSTQPEVARWESGEHQITMMALNRIADALGVKMVVRFGLQASS